TRTRLEASGFRDQEKVKTAVASRNEKDIRGAIGEEIGRLEAEHEYPASEGHRVYSGVLVLEAIPGYSSADEYRAKNPRGKPVREINGKVWLPLTDIDTLVLK